MHKILREVSKLLRLNLFEATLLHWMLKSADLLPRLEDRSLSAVIAELVAYDEFTFDSNKYNYLFANVLFNAYYVKTFVNPPEFILPFNK